MPQGILIVCVADMLPLHNYGLHMRYKGTEHMHFSTSLLETYIPSGFLATGAGCRGPSSIVA